MLTTVKRLGSKVRSCVSVRGPKTLRQAAKICVDSARLKATTKTRPFGVLSMEMTDVIDKRFFFFVVITVAFLCLPRCE